MSGHGYGPYTNGCRCDICKAAKAAYHRDKRAEAAANARPGVAVDGVKHATRRAYKDHGCRCEQCVTAMRAIWRGWSQAKRHPEAVAS